MKKKYLPSLLLVMTMLLPACSSGGDTSSQTSSSNESSETSSSESKSSENTTSEESSETSSSEEIPPESNKITLFNPNSKFFTRELDKKDTVASLRTYHHKDFDDVPFIDFNEYHYAVKPYIEKSRKFYQLEENKYVYSRLEDTGKMTFDTDKNTITITNAGAFYYDAIGTNNGVDGDMTNNNIKLYTGSEKTKVLEEGKEVVVNLNDYNMDIVSENNHLYVPVNIVNTLLLAPITAGLCFNGADYFTDSAMRNKYTSIFARSGNFASSWMLTVSEAPTAFKKVENKLSDEVYRFEGIFSGINETDELITFSLFNDHKGTMNGTNKTQVHYAFNWSEDENYIHLKGGQTFMESRDIEDAINDLFTTMINKKPTNYGLGKRSKAVAKMNFDELRLSFDYTYGLKEKLDVNKLIENNEELKNNLLSEDIMVYEDAFDKLINYYIDDIHSSVNGGESVYSSSPSKSFLIEKNGQYQGNRNKAYYDEVHRLGNMKNASSNQEAYAISGDTAYLKFHLFIHTNSASFPFLPYTNKAYQTENYEEAQRKVLSALNDSPYYAFCVAFNDILKHDNIKNIVIDLTGNIGGEIRCLPYISAFLTLDPSIVYRNTLDNSLLDFHYKVDLNGDGTFGGEGDSFQGKYNFYLLDGANFSCGNEFATIAKNTGFAKLLGEKSAGGSCAVGNRVDSSGLTYRLSSPFNLQLKQKDGYITNDDGVDVDYTLPFDNWFELNQLDAFLKTLN